jgi:hypothetical protein
MHVFTALQFKIHARTGYALAGQLLQVQSQSSDDRSALKGLSANHVVGLTSLETYVKTAAPIPEDGRRPGSATDKALRDT